MLIILQANLIIKQYFFYKFITWEMNIILYKLFLILSKMIQTPKLIYVVQEKLFSGN